MHLNAFCCNICSRIMYLRFCHNHNFIYSTLQLELEVFLPYFCVFHHLKLVKGFKGSWNENNTFVCRNMHIWLFFTLISRLLYAIFFSVINIKKVYKRIFFFFYCFLCSSLEQIFCSVVSKINNISTIYSINMSTRIRKKKRNKLIKYSWLLNYP